MYCGPSTKQSNICCYSLGLLMTTLIINRVPEILNKYLKCNGAATPLTDLSSFKKNISGQIEILFTQYTVIEPKSKLAPCLDNSRYCAFLAGSLLSPHHNGFSCTIFKSMYGSIYFAKFGFALVMAMIAGTRPSCQSCMQSGAKFAGV